MYAKALFYDPHSNEPGKREGIPEDRFVADWGEFEFIVDYGTRKFSRTFTIHEVVQEIARVKPTAEPRPRVTRKDD